MEEAEERRDCQHEQIETNDGVDLEKAGERRNLEEEDQEKLENGATFCFSFLPPFLSPPPLAF